jgi:hypothetical protein
MRPIGLTAARTAALIALLCARPASPASLSAPWVAIRRLPGETPVTVLVDGKPRAYFRVTPARPLVVPFQGPARLRITSRVDFARTGGVLTAYSLRLLDGTRELERQNTESAPSSRVQASETGRVGKRRRMTVDVPAGRRTLRLAVEGVGSVLVRLHRAGPRVVIEPTVSLTPVEAAGSVLVAEGEKTIPYYSVQAGKPVRIRLVGPTSLQLITRLDFDSSMRGTQVYRLAVTEGGWTLRTLEVKTTKASTASYTNAKDRVPSKIYRVALAFGEGAHDIRVELLAPAGATAEIHARIPEPTVGNEE